MRAETGPMKFGDDWPGIFIRGKHAFYFLKVCEALRADNPVTEAGLADLKKLLETSDHLSKEEVVKMKSFNECMEESE